MRRLTQILNPYWSSNGRLVGKDSKGVLYVMPTKAAKAVFGEEKLPELIYAIVAQVEYKPLKEGEPVIKRDDIVAAFKTKAAALEAFNSDRLLEAEAEAHFQHAVASLNVSSVAPATVEQLQASA